MLSVTFVGRYFINLNTKLFNRIPVLKTIFNGLTQLTKSFLHQMTLIIRKKWF